MKVKLFIGAVVLLLISCFVDSELSFVVMNNSDYDWHEIEITSDIEQ